MNFIFFLNIIYYYPVFSMKLKFNQNAFKKILPRGGGDRD